MKGKPAVVDALRKLLKFELTAINQSFLHARMCLDWGYDRVAAQIRRASIDNMVHAEQLIDRILFLESVPNLRDIHAMQVGDNVAKIHRHDLHLTQRTAVCANEGVAVCIAEDEDASRELIEGILSKEEDRIDWLEAQIQIIDDTGLGLYLSQQMRQG